MYYEFTVGGNTYKLRLNTRQIVLLEKKIGCNPLQIFGDGETLPTVSIMIAILQAALQQYNHNTSEEETYTIFDKWLEEGNAITDFVNIIIEIYKVSGLVKIEKN